MSDRTIKALTLVGDPSGCTLWRTWQPIAELQRQGYVGAEWEYNERPTLYAVAPAFDAYVLARLSWKSQDYEKGVKWAEAMRRAGKALIYESDDDLFSPWIVPQQKAGVQAGSSIAQLEDERIARIRALQLCDGVTVSTPRLATVVRQYVSEDTPVVVVPNSIDLRWWKAVQRAGGEPPQYGPPGSVVIGWAGGTRPDLDMAMMAEAWGRVARRYPQAHFAVIGHQPDVIGEHVPPERVTRVPWHPLDLYPLALRGLDIGCCPLVDRPFNRCKTPIKAMEYAASGAAVVASPTVYAPLVEDGVSGALCRTVGEWEATLGRLIDEPETRRAWMRTLRRKVAQEHSLERQVWRWPAAWEAITEQYRARAARRLLVS